MKTETEKKIKLLLSLTGSNLNKESFKKLLFNMASIAEEEMKNESSETSNYIYNISRVFLKKHFDILYKNDEYLLAGFENSPDIIFGKKLGPIKHNFRLFNYYIRNELEQSKKEKYEIDLIKDSNEIHDNVTIVCYCEIFYGTKQEALKKAEELKNFFEVEIARVTKFEWNS